MNSRIPTKGEIDAMTDSEFKVLENRLRRAAARQGLLLQRSRMRDPRGLTYGTYQLVDGNTKALVAADWDGQRGYGLDLEAIAHILFGNT